MEMLPCWRASSDYLASVWQEATTTAAETKEHGEPKEMEAVPKEDADQDGEKETRATEAAGELPASTPASVA